MRGLHGVRGGVRGAAAAALLAGVMLCLPMRSNAYSVLSHEQVVDQAWKPVIVPILLARFPGLTAAQIEEAHSYAYGGSVIQDIGYYPHGSQFMSDLMHYVRSGDFVSALLRDAQTPDEFAFACGALAHYAGDISGHPAVNRVTAQENPKLAAKFGPVVTYDQDHIAHVRTEFGFEVVEVANGKYQEQNYRDFVGFHVSKALLNRAFQETYGISVDSVVKDEDKTINSYRRDVSKVIPEATRVAWASYRKQIVSADNTATAQRFRYRLSRTGFEREWGRGYQQPTAKEKFLALVVRILPKIGPLRALKISVPNAKEQDEYKASMLSTEDRFRGLLAQVQSSSAGTAPQFAEMDLDTGAPTAEGEYSRTDATYAELLGDVTAAGAPAIPSELRADILNFYSTAQVEPAPPAAAGASTSAPVAGVGKDAIAKDPAAWARVQQQLAHLRNTASSTSAPGPSPQSAPE